VPARLGGRWAATVVDTLRPVFRRDAALAIRMSNGILRPYLSALLAQDGSVTERIASHVLSGHECAVAEDGLALGSDGGRPVLQGRKVRLLGQAGASLLVAVLHDGDLSHVAVAELPVDALEGARAEGVVSLDRLTVPVLATDVLSDPVTAYAVTGALTSAAALAAAESALAEVSRFAANRELYGTTVDQLPHARGMLTGARLDLLMADQVVRAAVRAVDEAVPETGFDAQPLHVASYVLPRIVSGTLRDLATVLGARSYLREGEHAAFGDHFRGLAALQAMCGDPCRCLPPDRRSPAGALPAWISAAAADLCVRESGLPDSSKVVSSKDTWARFVKERLELLDEEVRPPLEDDDTYYLQASVVATSRPG